MTMKRTLAILSALLLAVPAAGLAAQEMTLTAINVGKADCLLLQYGDVTYLIDTGTVESWGAVSAALRALDVRRVDGVILTHCDKDHAGGIQALASSSIEVGQWIASKYYCEVTEDEHPAVLAAAQRGAQVTWMAAGDSLPFADGTLEALGPRQYFSDSENNDSLVLLAKAAGASVLLAGDMEEPAEQLLLAAGVLSRVTVLKVGHHGEGDATSAAFVQAVSPRVAVISTNSVAEPDTPSKKVLKRLKQAGAQIALTESTQGAVRVRASQGSASVELLSWENLPALPAGVALTAKDAEDDTVRIENRGSQAADLSGWFIRSGRGNEVFVFPEGSVLAAGAAWTVSTVSSPKPGDFVWQDKNVWHNSKADPATLMDVYGREVSRLE